MPEVRTRGGQKKPIKFKEENGCYVCISHARDWDGYPLFKRRGRTHRISRYIYEECYGYLDKNKVVRHTCDNRACINPEHLIPGTHKENSMDMVIRGRTLKGEKHKFSKLKDKDIREIRDLAKNTTRTEIAEKFGINIRTVYKILAREVWKHV